jgi:hypothetical protein
VPDDNKCSTSRATADALVLVSLVDSLGLPVDVTLSALSVPNAVMLVCAAVCIVPYIPLPTYRALLTPMPPDVIIEPVLTDELSVVSLVLIIPRVNKLSTFMLA